MTLASSHQRTEANELDTKAGPKIKEAIESFEDDVQMDDSMIE